MGDSENGENVESRFSNQTPIFVHSALILQIVRQVAITGLEWTSAQQQQLFSALEYRNRIKNNILEGVWKRSRLGYTVAKRLT